MTIKADLYKHRILGKTNLPIFPIGFGAAALSGEGKGYGFGPIQEHEAFNLLYYALEKGMNLIDTAPVYGMRLAEKRVGKALDLRNMRKKVLLMSKGGITWNKQGRIHIDNSPKTLEKMLKQTLIDLKTDYLDFYLLHWPDKRVDVRKSLEYLIQAQEQGLIRYIGLGNTNLQQLKLAEEVISISFVQNEYNFFNSTNSWDETPFFNYIKKNKMGFIGHGTLDKGILAGTVNLKRKFDPVDARSWAPWWSRKKLEKKLKILEKIRHDFNLETFPDVDWAMAFTLQNMALTCSLCGARNFKQVDRLINRYKKIPCPQLIKKIHQELQKLSNFPLSV